MTDTIYARPAQYDLEHEGDDADVLFYLEFVRRRQPRRVLELGCGSGRVTIPLAQAAAGIGFHIVGIDQSEQMLEQASAKASELEQAARGRLSFCQGDARTWVAPEPFDLVIVPCSTLSHLLSLEDQLATWRRAHDNLETGGRFIADVTMPNLPVYADSMQQPPRSLVEMDVDAKASDGSRLIRYRATRYLPHEQRARIHFLYDSFDASDRADRYASDFDCHVYFPRELELLFLHTGFAVESKWGDYRLRPLRDTSREIIMVGRRTA